MFLPKYFAILRKHSTFSFLRLIALGLAAGISGTVLLIIINEVIALDPGNKNFYPKLFIGFAAVLGIHQVVQLLYQNSLIRLSQHLIWSLRINILNNVRQVDLLKYEAFGSGRVLNVLTADAGSISFVGNLLATVTVCAVNIFTCLIYLAYLTLPGFFVTLVIMLFIGSVYKITENRIIKGIGKAKQEEDAFFEYLNNIIFGIKELKLDPKKSRMIFDEAKVKAHRARELLTRCSIDTQRNSLLGGLFFFGVIGIFLFVLPYFNVSLLPNTPQYILVTLYVLRPAQEIAHTLPFFYHARVGIDRFNELSALNDMKAKEVEEPAVRFENPKSVALTDVRFTYKNEETDRFALGPLNFKISAGKIAFITGGNGSGKSTLINLLCGLYVPDSGSVSLDGHEICDENIAAYRSLFSAVFTDSYLFRKHFGIEPSEDSAMNALLARFGLKSKVNFENATFSTIRLSYGQRKRLSLASSIIENKSIYIFDEVCANQDAAFKVYFYNTILPALRQEGKMVIVITHDDKFSHVADAHYHMESGTIIEKVYSVHV